MDENNPMQNAYDSGQQGVTQPDGVQQGAAQQPDYTYQQPQYQQAQYQQPQYQQAYQQPQPGVQQPYYGNPQQGGYQYAQPVQYYTPQAAPFENNSTTYIVLSVLEFLFCGGLFAIIPFIFSLQYRDAYLQGNYDLAATKKKNAKTALIVILIVGIVLTILAIALTVGLGVYSMSVYG